MKILRISAVLLLLAVNGHAKVLSPEEISGWTQNGVPVADTDNVKSKNGFGAQVWVINDASFFKNWEDPETPHVPVAKTAHRNKPVFIIFLFINPGVDKDLNADVLADVTISGPDGKVYGQFKNMDLWHGPYEAPVDSIQLAFSQITLIIEDADILGTYTITATVKDAIKNIAVDLKTEVIAGE